MLRVASDFVVEIDGGFGNNDYIRHLVRCNGNGGSG